MNISKNIFGDASGLGVNEFSTKSVNCKSIFTMCVYPTNSICHGLNWNTVAKAKTCGKLSISNGQDL